MDKYVSASKLKAKVISGEPVLFDEPTQHEIFFLLESEPSEDVEPVVHAHWIKGAFGDVNVTCSNCDFHLCIPDSVIPKLAYCPRCGAAMDTSGKSKDKR